MNERARVQTKRRPLLVNVNALRFVMCEKGGREEKEKGKNTGELVFKRNKERGKEVPLW